VAWAFSFAAHAPARAVALLDAPNEMWLAGTFTGPSLSFGAFTLRNADPTGLTSDVYVVRVRTDLNASAADTPYLYAARFGGPLNESVSGLVVDANGAVLVGGAFDSPNITLGSFTVRNAVNALSGGAPTSFLFRMMQAAGGEWTVEWALTLNPGSGAPDVLTQLSLQLPSGRLFTTTAALTANASVHSVSEYEPFDCPYGFYRAAGALTCTECRTGQVCCRL
jgi:hypothetical protein